MGIIAVGPWRVVWVTADYMQSAIVAQYAYQSPWYAYPYHSYPYSYPYAARLARRGGEGAGGYPRSSHRPIFTANTQIILNIFYVMLKAFEQRCTVVEAEKGKKKRLECNLLFSVITHSTPLWG